MNHHPSIDRNTLNVTNIFLDVQNSWNTQSMVGCSEKDFGHPQNLKDVQQKLLDIQKQIVEHPLR